MTHAQYGKTATWIWWTSANKDGRIYTYSLHKVTVKSIPTSRMLWGQEHSWGALSIWVVLKSNKKAKLAVAFQQRSLLDWRRAGPRTASHQCCCSWEQMQQLYWVCHLLIYTDTKSVSLSKISISLLNAYYEPIIWLSTIKKERVFLLP